MLTCEFCEISKNTFFYRTPTVVASEGQEGFHPENKIKEIPIIIKFSPFLKGNLTKHQHWTMYFTLVAQGKEKRVLVSYSPVHNAKFKFFPGLSWFCHGEYRG